MKNTLRIAAVVLIIAVQFFGAELLFGEDIPEDQPIMTINGTVTQIDWVKGVIVVSYFGDEQEVSVPEGTPIRRGDDDIMLADIDIGDPVTVKYYNASPGLLKAVSINDNNLGNE